MGQYWPKIHPYYIWTAWEVSQSGQDVGVASSGCSPGLDFSCIPPLLLPCPERGREKLGAKPNISWWALFESKFEGVSPAAGERGKVKTKLEARNKTFLNWRKEQRAEDKNGSKPMLGHVLSPGLEEFGGASFFSTSSESTDGLLFAKSGTENRKVKREQRQLLSVLQEEWSVEIKHQSRVLGLTQMVVLEVWGSRQPGLPLGEVCSPNCEERLGGSCWRLELCAVSHRLEPVEKAENPYNMDGVEMSLLELLVSLISCLEHADLVLYGLQHWLLRAQTCPLVSAATLTAQQATFHPCSSDADLPAWGVLVQVSDWGVLVPLTYSRAQCRRVLVLGCLLQTEIAELWKERDASRLQGQHNLIVWL
ncbi:hypothetical protein Anapl_13859 [Anas platyrhynchos]|uniref:Uncharacterized protein n=1 Tax=Anas platyrhynchos TaxID=8839 RepID=R0LWS7_ANAPL|nr:hypothetical protein Anapl_13859 [Anas platyrhynchos]